MSTTTSITEVSARLPAQGKAIFFPRPRSSGAHSYFWLLAWRNMGEISTGDNDVHAGKAPQYRMCPTEKTLHHDNNLHMTTRGKLVRNTHKHFQFRANNLLLHAESERPPSCWARSTIYKLTFMAGGTRLSSPAALHRPECTERSCEDATWKPISCVIHQRTKPEPGGRTRFILASFCEWPISNRLVSQHTFWLVKHRCMMAASGFRA